MKFTWIHENCGVFEVRRMCRVWQVSTSGFYAWRDRPASVQRQRRENLAVKIHQIHAESRATYGSPRVYRAWVAAGERVCENTVARIMRQRQVRARGKRRFVPCTTESVHPHRLAPNRLERCFEAKKPNCKWVADITCIPTDQGWLYLAAVLDLYSRRIVGWSMAEHMRTSMVGDALTMAVQQRCPAPGLLHHSDRGVQYACDDYQQLLQKYGLQGSMSGKGNCDDNAAMESFWATLKTELVHQQRHATHQQARQSIFEYIEVFYNRKRLHSTLGYVSPEMFEVSLN